MLFSMTGYGAATSQVKDSETELEISLEIKTVNSKYLDIQFRMPRHYTPLERELAACIRDKLKRGRVEVSVFRRVLFGPVKELAVNVAQAKALAEAYRSVEKALSIPASLNLQDLLSQPDWLQSKDTDMDRALEGPALDQLFVQVLDRVIEVRKSEGDSLKRILVEQRTAFEKLFNEVAAGNSQIIPLLRERWKKRLKEIAPDLNLDPNRLEQELVLWVARSDFQEELDRISHHLQVFDKIISAGGETGRKMDFLLQELHREVNTLGSKCDQNSLTEKIVEMKSYLEKMKEQTQNLE